MILFIICVSWWTDESIFQSYHPLYPFEWLKCRIINPVCFHYPEKHLTDMEIFNVAYTSQDFQKSLVKITKHSCAYLMPPLPQAGSLVEITTANNPRDVSSKHSPCSYFTQLFYLVKWTSVGNVQCFYNSGHST